MRVDDFIKSTELKPTPAYFKYRELGGKIRKQDFLSLFRSIKGIAKKSTASKNIPKKYKVIEKKLFTGYKYHHIVKAYFVVDDNYSDNEIDTMIIWIKKYKKKLDDDTLKIEFGNEFEIELNIDFFTIALNKKNITLKELWVIVQEMLDNAVDKQGSKEFILIGLDKKGILGNINDQ